MADLDAMLLTEYERLKNVKTVYQEELDKLPKGCLSRKFIGGREYFYLQHRENGRHVSQYVPREQVKLLREQVERRRRLKKSLQDIEQKLLKVQKVIEKFG